MPDITVTLTPEQAKRLAAGEPVTVKTEPRREAFVYLLVSTAGGVWKVTTCDRPVESAQFHPITVQGTETVCLDGPAKGTVLRGPQARFNGQYRVVFLDKA